MATILSFPTPTPPPLTHAALVEAAQVDAWLDTAESALLRFRAAFAAATVPLMQRNAGHPLLFLDVDFAHDQLAAIMYSVRGIRAGLAEGTVQYPVPPTE